MTIQGIRIFLLLLACDATAWALESNENVVVTIIGAGRVSTNEDYDPYAHFNIPRAILDKTCDEFLAVARTGQFYSAVAKIFGAGNVGRIQGVEAFSSNPINEMIVTYYCTDGRVTLCLDYDDDRILRTVKVMKEPPLRGKASAGASGAATIKPTSTRTNNLILTVTNAAKVKERGP